jgi:hypothetical protein
MEITFFIVLLGITILFFILLILKSFFLKEKKICTICASMSLTWIILLALSVWGKFFNPVLVALLLGQTVVGIFYVMERKVREELTLFRLPFLLTLTYLAYGAITFALFSDLDIKILLESGIFLAILWGIFLVFYFYRHHPVFQEKVQKIIECCKRW